MCGEHSHCLSPLDIWVGSSPRVRGAFNVAARIILVTRIIPACAGSIHALRDVAQLADGSSPRVRGALLSFSCAVLPARIIPACAGSMSALTTNAKSLTDHPRVCGEHVGADYKRQIADGSSPRVRGAYWCLQYRPSCKGIIPACAGSIAPRYRP